MLLSKSLSGARGRLKPSYLSARLLSAINCSLMSLNIVKNSLCVSLLLFSFAFFTTASHAGSLEQAKVLHDRLAGVPADSLTLSQMAEMIENNQTISAAELAMENTHFYNTTLKLFASPWTNLEQDIFEPLNDYSATVIGMVRDDIDFRQVLQADMVYIGDAALALPTYSNDNNEHYLALENEAVDLKDHLRQVAQSSLNGLPSEATAGVLTSRAAAKDFFYLGTNRAMLRFTLINHLCTDLEPLKDNTRPADRIRQDVSRSPGGDSRLFLNNCVACHAGMDPLAQAFAYYNYQFDSEQDADGEFGRIVYSENQVQTKYHINSTNFPLGYVTPDDNWVNYWRAGNNQILGWDPALSGYGKGAKSLGKELANSDAFATCQVKKVFTNVCLRTPETSADLNQITETTNSFKQNGYRLKGVFAEVASYCTEAFK
ncbi:hypothetical protein [Catenovulum sediminis]|uniref:DUF1585 domain-containing protein n=1 Tax=Catenovulum sediminis TaxID=1740262 RepID=A0ABV1RLU7_9ALTE|nr:hypothetical protein [Catenovulum sediminis]